MLSEFPLNLEAAETDFRAFLVEHRYPLEVEWISIENVVIDGSGKCFVHRNRLRSQPAAASRYDGGLERKLGVVTSSDLRQ